MNETSNSQPQPAQGCILIVDDTPMNLRLASDLLAYEGYEVLQASDSIEAAALLASRTPDLILMDIQLPGMDGLAFTRLLRSQPSGQSLKIIALTAFAMKGDLEKALAAGCDGYITKPINTREFPRQIARALAHEKI